MMLRAVTDKEEIARCQRGLEKALKRSLRDRASLAIGHQGNSFTASVNYGAGLWYSTSCLKDEPVPRFWNAFGTEIRKKGNLHIVVEVNPALDGSAKAAGLFARDERPRRYYLLHSGGIGGGRKGIGKNAFRDFYDRGSWRVTYRESGKGEEAILITSLDGPDMVGRIRLFVQEVDRFKKEATSGSLNATPEPGQLPATFHPEHSGTVRAERKASTEYETYHGLVVEALRNELCSERPVNNRMMDLAVLRRGRLTHLFEVKTSGDLQSLYHGIGQLLFHTEGRQTTKRTLVLPSNAPVNRYAPILARLGIGVLTFVVKAGRVEVQGKVEP